MYDNDLDNNNTSSGVTGSESQNSQESTEYRYTSGSMPYNDNSYNSSYNNNTWNSNNGGYYSNTNYSNTTGNTNYNKKKNKTDKKGIGKRIAAIALSAVLFGVIAGGTMYGVNYAANKINPVNNNSNVEIPIVSSSVSSTSGTVNDESSAYNVKMDVAAVANAAMPAMVALQGTTTVSGSSSSIFGYGQSYEATTSGTGIIVGKSDTELLLLTNAHVIDGVSNLKCTFVDGESVNCTVKGSKSDKDIAVVAVNLSDIKSSTINQISIAELGDSDDVTLGQEVVAIGNALGEGQSVTNGIISAMNRSITVNNVTFDGLFMTNAAINSGNRETRTKVADSEASYLGISGVDITSTISQYYKYPQGVQIRSVASGSAAEKAGLGQYDIIVSFDDESISSMSELQNTMQYYKAGETVTIKYYHPEGTQYVLKSVDVTLGKKN